MMKKVQNIFYVVGAVILGFITFTMYQQRTPIPIFVPEITMEELDTRAAAAKQTEERVAANTRARKLVACSVDDDCIIVDKDPCGCLVGSAGVTSINVNHVLDFNETQSGYVFYKKKDNICLQDFCDFLYEKRYV